MSEYERPELISWSQFRRYYEIEGEDWWVDQDAPANGIGPVCLFCGHLIDWAPRDHKASCPVRRYMRWDDEDG